MGQWDPQMWGGGPPNVGWGTPKWGLWGSAPPTDGCTADGDEDDLEGYPKSVPGRRRGCRVRAGNPNMGRDPQVWGGTHKCGVGALNGEWDP